MILAGALIGNVGAMREGAGYLRDESAAVDGARAALPLVASRVGPDFQPDPASAPQIRAAAYLDAVRDLGSDAPSPRALPGLYERGRARADESLRRALSPRLTPSDGAPRGAAPQVDAVQAATQQAKGACQIRHVAGRCRDRRRRRPARRPAAAAGGRQLQRRAAALRGRLRQADRHRARRRRPGPAAAARRRVTRAVARPARLRRVGACVCAWLGIRT